MSGHASDLDAGGALPPLLTYADLDKRAEEFLLQELGEVWRDLPHQSQKDARAAAVDLVKLGVRHFKGEDVRTEVAYVQATVAALAAVLAENSRERFVESVVGVARILGEILGALAVGAAKGALKGLALP